MQLIYTNFSLRGVMIPFGLFRKLLSRKTKIDPPIPPKPLKGLAYLAIVERMKQYEKHADHFTRK